MEGVYEKKFHLKRGFYKSKIDRATGGLRKKRLSKNRYQKMTGLQWFPINGHNIFPLPRFAPIHFCLPAAD